jgi:hypothetical protein
MHSFSKDPDKVLQDAIRKGYSRVRFQQGKPLLDRELNLLGDLSSPQRIAGQYIGSGVPAGSDGFAIDDLNVAGSDFSIKAGNCLVNGEEVDLADKTSYRKQPHREKVGKFPEQAFNVYLRIFPTEITDTEDADLKNTGDVGFVTAIREKTDWEVLVSAAPINQPDHYLLATIDPTANKVTDRRRRGLTVAALLDEHNNTRGDVASLGARLNTSLTADGKLKGNTVSNAQIVKDSVDKDKLAAKSVSIAKMSATLVVEGEFSVAAAPGPGQVGERVVNIEATETHAFYLISVRQIAPRTAALPQSFLQNVTWVCRNQVIKLPNNPKFIQANVLVIQNSSTTDGMTVACKVYRIDEI